MSSSYKAVHDYPPDRDGERLRGQGRVQHRQRLSHGARSPAPFAKEIAAWPPTAGSIGRGLGQRGGTIAQKRSGPAAGRHFRRDPAPPSPTGAAGTTAARLAAAERSRSPAAIPRNGPPETATACAAAVPLPPGWRLTCAKPVPANR